MKNIFILMFLFVAFCMLNAQEAVTASGNNGENSTAKVSWTIGQTFVEPMSNSTHELSPGVQQTTLIVTALNEISNKQIAISVFPNPTTDFLELKVDGKKLTDMSYQIFDSNGRLIEHKKISNSLTRIETNNLAIATYFIKISHKNSNIKTFQIIKK